MRSFFNKLRSAPKVNRHHRIPIIWVLMISVLAGGVLPLALAPYHFWWLALLSPALLYACLHQRSAKQAFGIGWAFGFAMWFIGGFWLYTSIHNYGNVSSPLSVTLIALLAMLMGLFNAAQAWVYRRFFPETPLSFAPLWVLFEWLKTWLFTGFPWLFIGYAFTNYTLDEYAPLLGVFGVSLVVVVIAAGLTECLFGKRFWLLPMAMLFIAALAAKQLHWVSPKATPALSVSLIQGNIPQDLKWREELELDTLNIYSRLSETEWGRDLVVWPESAIPMFQVFIPEFLTDLDQWARTHHSAWVTGIPYKQVTADDQHTPLYYNAIMASGQNSSGVYFKQRLVPFGEYVPLAGVLNGVMSGVQVGLSMFSPGDSHQAPLLVKDRRLAAAICYEIAYPNLTRRNSQNTDFLVTISNDAWFTGSDGPWQHLQMAQMRAKENGRWIIRATNTGVTAIINDQGHIVKQLASDQRAVLRGELPAMTGQTPYSRYGDWSVLLFCAGLLMLSLYYKIRLSTLK